MATVPATPRPTEVPVKRSFARDLLVRLFRERPLGAWSGVVVLVLGVVAVFADVLAPFPFSEIHLIDRLSGSTTTYLLGTDQLGRDMLSRLIYGARLSLGVGIAATSMSLVVSLLIGGVGGFVGGKLDIVVQRFVDAWLSFPGLLLLITILSTFGRGVLQIIIILGISAGIGNARVVRSAVIAIKANPYFEAARSIGSRQSRTLLRHVWPNITAPIIVIFSITIGGVIISEASLSFLGFGLPEEVPSWGAMLSKEGRKYMEVSPRLAMLPGLALTLVVYCLNMLGDALRDLLDPRLRGAGGASSGGGSYGRLAARDATRALQRAERRQGRKRNS